MVHIAQVEKMAAIRKLAGVSDSVRSLEVTAFVGAAAFVLGAEEPIMALMTVPQLRHERGPGRLLVLTATRAIEVIGDISGDWWSSIQRAWPTDVSVRVRDLEQMPDLEFTGDGRMWLLEETHADADFLAGTSAALIDPVGAQRLELWDGYQPGGSAVAEAASLITALRFLASRKTRISS